MVNLERRTVPASDLVRLVVRSSIWSTRCSARVSASTGAGALALTEAIPRRAGTSLEREERRPPSTRFRRPLVERRTREAPRRGLGLPTPRPADPLRIHATAAPRRKAVS